MNGMIILRERGESAREGSARLGDAREGGADEVVAQVLPREQQEHGGAGRHGGRSFKFVVLCTCDLTAPKTALQDRLVVDYRTCPESTESVFGDSQQVGESSCRSSRAAEGPHGSADLVVQDATSYGREMTGHGRRNSTLS